MKIHIHSRPGMFGVKSYNKYRMTLFTKHTEFQVPVSDFKKLAGNDWNFNVSKIEIDRFLSTVQPKKVKELFKLEKNIISIIDDRIKIVEAEDERSWKEEADKNNEFENPMEPTIEDYERWWREESDKNNKLNNKIRSIAHQVYSQNLDFSNFQNDKGIKFIIQQNYKDKSYRFCWDPYGFVFNFHSNISSIFSEDGWCTANGGWIKVIDDNVILYSKSGDYGVYDDTIAIECAKKVFPTKKVHSFAGRSWEDGLESKFFSLPF